MAFESRSLESDSACCRTSNSAIVFQDPRASRPIHRDAPIDLDRHAFVSASGALDHQKVLPELIGKTLDLEILAMSGTVYIYSHGLATIFTAQTAFEHDEWTRKGLSFLQQSRLPVVCARRRSWGYGLWQLGAVAGRPNRGSQPLQRGVSVRPVRTRMASGVSN